MNNKKFLNYLNSKKACENAIEWTGKRLPKQVWNECERGDWMLWLISKSENYSIQQITAIKVECAELVKHLMKDERSLKALEVAKKFSKGKATIEELKAATAAANAAVAVAAYAADAYAYAAAANAAATNAAAAAAAYAAYAAYAANAAANAADAYAETLKKCADICRKHIKMVNL